MMLGTPNVDRATARRLATRQEILDAAWSVVREAGWSGLTLRLVADRVGMRAPSLYSHFDSKLAIVDAMFRQAWEEYDAANAAAEARPTQDSRDALLRVAETFFDHMTADPERYLLMNQRAVPGFTPSAESYAPSVRSLERLHGLFRRLGIEDPDAADLLTALLSGLVNQQIANDPGGVRWRRLLPRAVDMYADEIGVPPAPRTNEPRTTTTRTRRTSR